MEDIVTIFCKGLIKAKPIETIDVSKAEEINNFIFKELIPFVDKTNIYEDEFSVFEGIKNNYNSWSRIARKPWLKNKTVISIMGRFSAGKSSIVNSILGEKLLPVDVTPTTAVSTYISYGPETQIRILDNDDEIKELDINIFNRLTKESLKDFPFSYLIRHFVVEYNNKHLKEKSILDTPGYDSLDDRDRKRALDVVEESAAIFWTVDINDGDLSKDALSFIKENLSEKLLFFIITKADTKSPMDQESILNRIERSLRDNEIKYQSCILYSAKNPQDNKKIEALINEVKSQEKVDFYSYTLKFMDDLIESFIKEETELKKEKNKLEIEKEGIDREISNLNKKYYKDIKHQKKSILDGIKAGWFCGNYIVDIEEFKEDLNTLVECVKRLPIDIAEKKYNMGSMDNKILGKEDKLKKYEKYRNDAIRLKNRFKYLMEDVL